MLTLTQTAILTKRFIAISVALVLIGVVSLIGYRIWYINYLSKLPPPEEKPNMKFGVLPKVELPPTQVTSSNFTYSLDTTTGGFPSFEKTIKIYFMPKSNITLLAAQKSEALAKVFNIEAIPEIVTDTKYRYKQDDKSLTIELDAGSFIYTKESTSTPKLLPANTTIDEEKLAEQFKSTLSKLGVLKEDFTQGPKKISLVKFLRGQPVTTADRSQAQGIKISIWPADIDKKLILTNKFDSSLISAVVDSTNISLENYLSLNFSYWPIDKSTYATYPLKNVQDAYDELQSGKATVVVTPTKPQVSITSVYLAYFMPESYSSYLQPIYVFEGPGFVAYVPALLE